MKHHYSINVQANGENHIFNVFCEEENLGTIADALCDYYRYVQHKGRIACVAKKGGGVSVNDFDILYRDCM